MKSKEALYFKYVFACLFFYFEKVKMGKQLLSHRYNFLPLLRSRPGGVQKELIVEDLPTANVRKDSISGKLFLQILMEFCGIFSNLLILNRLRLK